MKDTRGVIGSRTCTSPVVEKVIVVNTDPENNANKRGTMCANCNGAHNEACCHKAMRSALLGVGSPLPPGACRTGSPPSDRKQLVQKNTPPIWDVTVLERQHWVPVHKSQPNPGPFPRLVPLCACNTCGRRRVDSICVQRTCVL